MKRDYRNPELSAEARAGILLGEMTIEEKCSQLVGVFPWVLVGTDGSDATGCADVLRDPPGHVAGLTLDDPQRLALLVGSLQRQFVERTRLGIPALIHAEALNGFVAGGHTVFPTGTGLAATWSPQLVEQMSGLIREQMRRTGIRQALAPVLDVALDPRWGRVHETYGEDPYLTASLGVAYVRGLQGPDLRDGVIATTKHFLGYGLAEGGINLSGAETGARRLRDVFAYPFEAAIQMAGLRSVMNSYGDVDSVPVGANREILHDLLRGTLGFEGFVSSDYATTEHLVARQHVASGPEQAARLAIAAGLDVELPTAYAYGAVLANEVRRGTVDPADLDASVERVLRAKFELGLFENPYPQERISLTATSEEGRDLSLELARRSVVLAKNEGILPLSQGKAKVAVIGPHADVVTYQFPTYTYPAWREMIIRMSRGELGNAIGVETAASAWNDELFPGVDAEDFLRQQYAATSLAQELGQFAQSVVTHPGSSLTTPLSSEAMEAAVHAAQEADVVVLALGGASLWFNSERTEGEASDSADISLPPAQQALAEAVAATGKPLVAVVVQGRAYALPEAVKNAQALVLAPYGGPFGMRAVAEVIFGQTNPSGKLPYSVPRHTGQIPIYHHQRSGTGRRNPYPPAVPQHYLDMPATPLYTFGHGLSYTSFALSDLRHDSRVETDGAMSIGLTVTNTGDRDGATVVQLYMQLESSGVTRPAQQLAGYARVELAAGESRELSFLVTAAQLGCTNAARDFAVEPGHGRFFIGLDSDDRQLEGSFELAGPTRVLTSAEREFLSEAAVTRTDDAEPSVHAF
ncbi:glycoside hydrolase family 3 N-terminal domain-containing protein [Sinomonas humi]|uniref:glycoside hydrolase family 3 N-terminal domain-containing protein n=1 Tax=Sinomonas humi TaxID=1338436 RepID=UPI00068D92FE|nr:glycoside hydrolase family 3 N-terminal domain-containing protein [Sinomonas humi]